MEIWKDFFVAMTGASAALTGLIFVGISISLQRILEIKTLPGRAGLALGLLMIVLIVSTLCLVPQVSINIIGVEILCCGIAAWGISLRVDLRILGDTKPEYKRLYFQNLFFTQLATLPYIVCGIWIIGAGASGVYWLIPAFLFSFMKAVLDAWVLLIEIHR